MNIFSNFISKDNEFCPQGYIGKVPDCKDLNECDFAYRNECDRLNAICINQVGGYTCECNEGFYGNGLTCLSEFFL